MNDKPNLENDNQPQSQDDEVVALCFDCLTVVPDYRAEKDIFLQAGQDGICPYCKGVMRPVYKSSIQKIKDNGGRYL